MNRPKFKNKMTHFGVAIATYQRSDGRTKELLSRALTSIAEQNYPLDKITVFLVGDKYEDQQEFSEIVKFFSERIRIQCINLPFAAERATYPKDALWSYGGVNAINRALDMASTEVTWLCHLDHDDYWTADHLSLINQAISMYDPAFVFTKSKYLNGVLPNNQDTTSIYLLRWCEPYQLIHSSVCMNIEKVPLKYRDIYKETGVVGIPADADMWQRVNEYLLSQSMKSIFVNRITCIHEEEGFERSK